MKNGMRLLFGILMSFAIVGLMAQPTNNEGIGIPSKDPQLDPLPLFKNPPLGYGQVPFYWWQGDTLTREKLTWQLNQLEKKNITSLQVNYSHTDDRKGLFWGSTLPSKPALFTEDWWELFGWFMKEANKRNMTVSLSDYTLGIGQGFAIDEVRRKISDIAGYRLIDEKDTCKGGDLFTKTYKHPPLSVVAYPIDKSDGHLNNKILHIDKQLKGNKLSWQSPKGGDWKIVAIYAQLDPNSYSSLHPLSGKAYVEHFFQPFEDRFPEQSKKGLNFFFSDELNLNMKGFSWSAHFQEEFIRRKGYDITPLLAHLFENISNETPKIRMDYNDVFVSMSEEYYFKPIYNWHQERGLFPYSTLESSSGK